MLNSPKLIVVMLIAFYTNDLYQVTLIPDPVFEQFLIDEGFDSGSPDGEILTKNIEGITSLNVKFNGAITDLTGIEDMKDLVYLNCDFNKIDQLDLSENLQLEELHCSNNLLTSLNLTANLKLKKLDCEFNELAQLDLTQNSDLVFLSAQLNALSEINVSNNALLEDLYVFGNNLETLDLSNNTNLRKLHCFDNKLTELDVSQNEKLEELGCHNNQLTNIHFSGNPNLEIIACRNNQLTHLNVSTLPSLFDLDASDNSLVCLNVKNGNNQQFMDFDIVRNPSLTCIEVDDPAFSLINWKRVDPGASFELSCNNGCNSVGTKEIPGELSAELFPNPSQELIHIEFEEPIGEGTWTIYNQIGQKILMQYFTNTDALRLNPELVGGVYLLQIETNEGRSRSFKIHRE